MNDMRTQIFLVACICLTMTACNHRGDLPGISPQAKQYLTEALDIMQTNYVYRDQINWPSIRTQIFQSADSMQINTKADTYPLIKYTLALIEAKHSLFIEPYQAPFPTQENPSSSTVDTSLALPEGQLTQNKFAYIHLPTHSSIQQTDDMAYANAAQEIIQKLDGQHPCAWIVDLRNNLGGNMWPMLAGIGPILGDGIVGSFIFPDGHQEKWSYQNGKAMLDNKVMTEITDQSFQLSQIETPVAVLINEQTVSSGEAVAIAFIGRPNARTFGTKTAGLTTSNLGFPLSDGAVLILTVAIDVDRNGIVYGKEIVPDVQLTDNAQGIGQVPTEALQWLENEPTCSSR